jgi:hypothetical protein
MKNYDLTVIIVHEDVKENIEVFGNSIMNYLKNYNINTEIISLSFEPSINKKSTKDNDQIIENSFKRSISNAKSNNVIITDSPDSGNYDHILRIYDEMKSGKDLVLLRNEQKETLIEKIISKTERTFINKSIANFRVLPRGIKKDSFKRLDMQTEGMQFLSEMVIKATLLNMNISEISYDTFKKNKNISSLRLNSLLYILFIFLYLPRWFFFYPGIILFSLGLIVNSLILFNDEFILDIHSMLFASILIIVGFQLIVFFVYSKLFAWHERLIPKNEYLNNIYHKISLEKGIAVGGILLFFGILIGLYNIIIWDDGTFYDLGIKYTFKYIIQSIVLIIIGINTIISSFFISFLMINRTGKKTE